MFKHFVLFVFGTICDQFSNPIEGALVEIWRANAAGKYLHQNDKNLALASGRARAVKFPHLAFFSESSNEFHALWLAPPFCLGILS